MTATAETIKYTPRVDLAEDGTTATIRLSHADIPCVDKIISKFSRRAHRAGVGFDMEISDIGQEMVPYRANPGAPVDFYFDIAVLTVTVPQIKIPGWELVAALDITDNGALVRCAPGKSLEDYERPDKHWCDHCETRRRRKQSFVVRHIDSGEYRQVGSACLASYTGITPAMALMALSWEDEVRAAIESSEHVPDLAYSVDTILRLAYVLSRGGKDFVSRSVARQNEGMTSTADRVTTAMINYQGQCDDVRAEAAAVQSQTIADIRDFAAAMEGDSDYVQNVRTLSAAETVPGLRSVALITSIVGVRFKHILRAENDARRAARASHAGHLGIIKERLRGLEVVVDNLTYTQGSFGTVTVVRMITDEGHVLTWFASNFDDDIAVGDSLVIDATVKSHGEFRGISQTVVTRATVHDVAPGKVSA